MQRGDPVPKATRTQALVLPSMPGVSQPADQAAGDDWAAYGGSQKATRFSPLAQISRNNVAQLQEVWRYHTGDLPKKRWGPETTPLKIGDSVYLCTPHTLLISLDARTGKQRWQERKGGVAGKSGE